MKSKPAAADLIRKITADSASPKPASRAAKATAAQQASDRLGIGRALAISLAQVASATRCHHVVVLEVSGISPITDYFVLASGTSPRQMRTVARDLGEQAQKLDYSAISRSGLDGESWMLIDFVDVVVHLFNDDSRAFYDLDNLWGDARLVEWRDSDAATRG